MTTVGLESPPRWLATELGAPHAFFCAVGEGGMRRSMDGAEAFSAAAAVLGRPSWPSAWMKQVHGDRVLHVAEPGLAGEADALWTDKPGLFLAVRTADCVPILLAGPGRVAAVHAGWRGLACGVIAAAVEACGGGADLRAAVGPCIGVDRYEVGAEVVEGIGRRVPSDSFVRRDLGPKPHVDLAAAAAWQLRAAGVASVQVVNPCTFDDPSFHSFRRDAGHAGRQAAMVGLAP